MDLADNGISETAVSKLRVFEGVGRFDGRIPGFCSGGRADGGSGGKGRSSKGCFLKSPPRFLPWVSGLTEVWDSVKGSGSRSVTVKQAEHRNVVKFRGHRTVELQVWHFASARSPPPFESLRGLPSIVSVGKVTSSESESDSHMLAFPLSRLFPSPGNGNG
jgi:hypothetical protein